METVKQITAMVWDHIVVNISGGKDSSLLMLWAVQNFPNHKSMHFVHSTIDIDWEETEATVRAQCAHFGVTPIFVQAVHEDGSKKGFLTKLVAARKNRKTGEIGENKFPDMGNRWCTSELKTAPIEKWVRQNLSGKILNLIGERAEESSQRAKLLPVRKHEKLTGAGREVWTCSPILEVKESYVWAAIKAEGIPVHPCYSWGVTRASCAICIFSSDEDIAIAAKHAPKIVAAYMEAEAKISHTFRYLPATKKRAALKQTIASILAAKAS